MRVTRSEDHDQAAQLCPTGGNRHAVGHYIRCTNCPVSQVGVFTIALLGTTALLAFLTADDSNPLARASERFNEMVMDHEEEIYDGDPLAARFTFTADGDSLPLTSEDAGDIPDLVPWRERRQD